MDFQFRAQLQTHFLPYCQKLGVSNLFDDLIFQLDRQLCLHDETVTLSETVLNEYIKRCIFGKASDRRDFLQKHLNLPLGPKLKLLAMMEESSFLNQLQEVFSRFNNTQEVLDLKVRTAAFEQVIKHSMIHQLWEEWRSGQVNTSELFSKLNYFLHEKFIDLKAYQFIVDTVLVEQGYSSYLPSNSSDDETAVLNLTTHVSYLLPHVSFDSVLSLQVAKEKNILLLATLDQKAMSLDVNGVLNHRNFRSYPSYSNHGIWWSYLGNADTFTVHNLPSLIEDKSVLKVVIGDHLRLERGILEIDQVQAFDSLLTESSFSPTKDICFAVIVQGRWKCLLDHCDTFINEGSTDAGGMDEFDNSPNGSGNEGSQQILPDYSFPNQFFLIFGNIYNDNCIIRDVHCLSDDFYPDQTPTKICLYRPYFGVLAGSNGLLSTFRVNLANYGSLSHYWKRSSAKTTDFDCSLQVKSLTEDSMHPHEDLQDQYVLSHFSDSHILSFDYCLNTSLLVSADSLGSVCLWKENDCPNFQLITSPYCEGTSRVVQIRFTPSGDHLIVCLSDRVQLMKITISFDSNYVSSAFSWMYERCCLDLSVNRICHYFFAFQEEEITIWKVMEEEGNSHGLHKEETSGILISCWTHKNIDSFLHRQAHYDTPTTSFSKLSPQNCPTGRKEAYSETDQVSMIHDFAQTMIYSEGGDDSSNSMSYGNDLLHEFDENMNFINYNGEYIPVYRESCLDISNLCLPYSVEEFNSGDDSSCLHVPLPQSRGLFLYSWTRYLRFMRSSFHHEQHPSFLQFKSLFAIIAASFSPPSVLLVAAALECTVTEIEKIIRRDLKDIFLLQGEGHGFIILRQDFHHLLKWMLGTHPMRIGGEFWIDVSIGHNLLCSLYLKHCGNKSVAVEHSWQGYLQTYGSSHLRRASRGLRLLTTQIRKIDETANIRHFLPHQIGYISGLQEIYARRVGLSGKIPKQLGELMHLRVLSMGNNRLTGELPDCLGKLKHLQRIVLHQNNLIGKVPDSFDSLGCIVNLAGNPRLEHGSDVPPVERQALIQIFYATNGNHWNTKIHWNSDQPVAKWYKVGVLSSHVHSLVMSSNGMEGVLPSAVKYLQHLRMIELATMPGLIGSLPKELCQIHSLRRLCICRCGLTGPIPPEIGLLTGLEELQLFGNNFTGSIPSSLGNLINLKLLSLGEYTGGNNFTPEPIPFCISRLVQLEALFLANCNISGVIPRWIGELRELRQLDLQRNNLTGSIPPTIGKLENLLYLNVKDNHALGGKLPLLELLSLSKLNRLSLVHCSFQDAEVVLEAMKVSLPRCKIWV